MSVQARFWVRSVERIAYSKPGSGGSTWAEPKPIVVVKMAVVSGPRAPENQQWASATPSGDITMTIGNPAAAAWFDSMLGEDIAVTFEARPADETANPG